MGELIGNHFGAKVGLVGEPDALLVRVVRFFAAYAQTKPPWMRYACSMVVVVSSPHQSPRCGI